MLPWQHMFPAVVTVIEPHKDECQSCNILLLLVGEGDQWHCSQLLPWLQCMRLLRKVLL